MDYPFLYQLQDARFEALRDADFRVAVVDTDDSRLSQAQISRLEDQGKTMLTYLSIGEAESYRSDWAETRRSGVILDENPDWDGNFRVEFWRPEWQRVVMQRVEQAVERGYAGVYLDIVDAYTVRSVREAYRGEDIREEMILFVKKISAYAKSLNPDFLIVPQNAVGLLSEEEGHPGRPNRDYIAAIDGIGVEDLWFDDNRRADWTDWDLELIERATEAGKFVLATSYPTRVEHQQAFIGQALEAGFLPFVGTRDLDKDVPAVNAAIPSQIKRHDTAFPDGGAGGRTIRGDGDAEALRGARHSDTLFGGAGNDTLRGEAGGDRLSGDWGNDRLHGGDGRDRLHGGGGRDELRGDRHADVLHGGKGADTLFGNRGDDRMFGDNGPDRLFGGRGSDRLDGGRGADVLDGGSGRDRLIHDSADTALRGGAGVDTLVFIEAVEFDFGARNLRGGIDRLDLRNDASDRVSISVSDVLNHTDQDVLYVLAEPGDEISGNFGEARGEVTHGGSAFAHFRAGGADLFVEIGATMDGEVLDWG